MSETKSLLSLVATTKSIEEMLIESGGELTPELEKALLVSGTELPEKIDNYALVMERMDGIADFYAAKAQAYSNLGSSALKVIERCKENLKRAMLDLQVTELVGIDAKFTLQNNAEACIIPDPALIDPSYTTVEMIKKVSINKDRIKEDLKLGVPVEGAYLERGCHVRMRANTPSKSAAASKKAKSKAVTP